MQKRKCSKPDKFVIERHSHGTVQLHLPEVKRRVQESCKCMYASGNSGPLTTPRSRPCHRVSYQLERLASCMLRSKIYPTVLIGFVFIGPVPYAAPIEISFCRSTLLLYVPGRIERNGPLKEPPMGVPSKYKDQEYKGCLSRPSRRYHSPI
ncbi:hypothetical protein EDB86DRAFT_1315129 [Lactarius hatsudake]|nr:hypothetical protein EDB86DRAFT_1315129 [Lactarius hatsudake]